MSTSAAPDRLIAGCKALGIPLSDLQIRQFMTFYEMLIEKNKVMNLTAITDFEEVQVKHFLDSLSLVKALDGKQLAGVKQILDLGTGAGFPGIPLKILFPEKEFVLADSLNKRILFLNEVIEALSLEKIQTVHGRAEELGRKREYRERFDLCVSRAVANLSTLSEYCLPFVRNGGWFISYKSINIDMELSEADKAIRTLGGGKAVPVIFSLPETDMERTLLLIRKEKETPARYPRRAGTPSREPL